ncbi:Gta1 protein [Saccharomycopsis crataegensis]|uniref:Gta1 protein n=1 Tax=Saccharomycopsis crataegensis TaxID=43959 RepID=A0AAV5QPZ2_9ASCO|nr:Gta1 protein [Saccharomycopsis crataegensis]
MIAQFICVALALLWLWSRLRAIYAIPIIKLIKGLAVNVPRVPIVSINELTPSRVSFRWDPTFESGTHHEIHLNGALIGVADYNQTSCVLRSLRPDSFYQIDVVAKNSAGFRSKSATVYVKTLRSSAYVANGLENPKNIVTFLTTDSHLDVKRHGAANAFRSRSNTLMAVGGISPLVIANGHGNGTVTHSSSKEDIRERFFIEIEELRRTLEEGQEDLRIIIEQQSTAIKEFQEKKTFFTEERDRQREMKRSGDRTRHSIRAQGKVLEENARYAKKELDTIQNEIKMLETDMKSKNKEMEWWSEQMKFFENKQRSIEVEGPSRKKKLEGVISVLMTEVKQSQLENSKLEELVRSKNQQRRQKEKSYDEIAALFKKFPTNLKDNKAIQSSLETLKELDQTIYDLVAPEVTIDITSEKQWYIDQQREVTHCTSVYGTFHEAKERLAKLTQRTVDRKLDTINREASELEQQQKIQQQQIQQQLQQQLQLPQNQLSAFTSNSNGSTPNNNNNVILGTSSLPQLSSSQVPQSQSSTNMIQNSQANYNSDLRIFTGADTSNDGVWNSILDGNKLMTNQSTPMFSNNKMGIDSRDPLESPSVETYLPANLFDNGLSENLIEDFRQYRHNIETGPVSTTTNTQFLNTISTPVLTNSHVASVDPVMRTSSSGIALDSMSPSDNSSTDINTSALNPQFKNHERSFSGFSQTSSISASSGGDQHHQNHRLHLQKRNRLSGGGDSPITQVVTLDQPKDDANGHSSSITSAFSPKRLFSFNRRLSSGVTGHVNGVPNSSIANFVGTSELQLENGVEMVTNANFFPEIDISPPPSANGNSSRFFGHKRNASTTDDDGKSENNNVDGLDKAESGGIRMSRFFGRKNESAKLTPVLSLNTTTEAMGYPMTNSESNTTSAPMGYDESLSQFFAPSSSLRVGRDRSGSINSGISIPQSFHTANINPWAAPTHPDQSSTSLSMFYPTSSNQLLPITSHDSANANISTVSQPQVANSAGTSWSLFHINRGSNPNNNGSIVDTVKDEPESPSLGTPKSPSSASRIPFFRREKDKQHSVTVASPLGMGSEIVSPISPSVPQPISIPDIQLNSPPSASVVSSPTQKKRKSIFSFSKSNKNDVAASLAEMLPSGGSTSSLENAIIDYSPDIDSTMTDQDLNDEQSSQGGASAHSHNLSSSATTVGGGVEKSSSKASKLFPKSMRSLGIARRSSSTSQAVSIGTGVSSVGATSFGGDGGETGSVGTGKSGHTDSKFISIVE